jgi:uncharacterized protein (TIGR02271 family)
MTLERLSEMRGTTVYDSGGEKIGSVEEIFYDEQTRQPEWIGIGTGFFGMKRVLVPVQGASVSSDGVTVPYPKDQVKDTPDIDGDEISEDAERELYSYYGIQPSESQSDTVLPAGGTTGTSYETRDVDTTARVRDDSASVTRSEEELAVGKREAEIGRARLRKWVETEPVETDVQLRRETVHVEREPINETVTDAELGEDSVEVGLSAEEAVVDKRVVGKERVSLDKDVETNTETVRDEVRKERVEVEGDTIDDASGRGRDRF